MPIHHLVYVSSAARKFSPADLLDLLAISRGNNARLDVTGMLLYADGNFIQAIEGPELSVEQLYRKISLDPRHHDVRKLFAFDDDTRDFPDWTMGLSRGPITDQLREHLGLVSDSDVIREKLALGRPTLMLLRGFADRAA